jgi:hypothetical protein
MSDNIHECKDDKISFPEVISYNNLSAPKAIVSKHFIHEDKIISIAIFTFSRANVLIMCVSSTSQIVQNCTT